eukprot:gene28099-36991_t
MQVVPSINQPGSVSDVEIIVNNDLGDLCKVDKDSEVLMQIGSQCVHVEESKLEAILIALVKCCGQITKRNVSKPNMTKTQKPALVVNHHDHHALCHFTASGIAAVINFPLWRASSIAQSGFKIEGSNFLIRYYKAVVMPPFKGLVATMFGMTWARAAIFYGSEVGKSFLLERNVYGPLAQTIPPLAIGVVVQAVR